MNHHCEMIFVAREKLRAECFEAAVKTAFFDFAIDRDSNGVEQNHLGLML